MTEKRARSRVVEPIASDPLDAFFAAICDSDRSGLIRSICGGVVTGSALSAKHGWRPDETTKQLKILSAGGLIEARRDGRWMRLVPQLDGVEAAKVWVAELRAPEPPVEAPSLEPDERYRRAQVLRNRGRRRLLTQIRLRGPAKQADLARSAGLSQAVTSRGLKQLVKGGLVAVHGEGRLTRYSIIPEAVESLWAWLTSAQARLAKGRAVAEAVDLKQPRSAEASAGEREPETALPNDPSSPEAGPVAPAVGAVGS